MGPEVARHNVVQSQNDTGYLLLGASLAVASMILLPAFAMRVGLGASLTGALRIALMKASSQVMANHCNVPDCHSDKK